MVSTDAQPEKDYGLHTLSAALRKKGLYDMPQHRGT